MLLLLKNKCTKKMIVCSRLRGNDSLFRGALLVGCASCYVLVARSYTKFGTEFHSVFFLTIRRRFGTGSTQKFFNHEEHKVLKTKYNNVYFEKDTKTLRFIQRI